jgi:hypothetical protein
LSKLADARHPVGVADDRPVARTLGERAVRWDSIRGRLAAASLKLLMNPLVHRTTASSMMHYSCTNPLKNLGKPERLGNWKC